MILNSIHHKVGGILAPGLLENVGAMLVYGALGDEELIGNLLIGEATTYLNKNLDLTIGECILLALSLGS